MSMKKEYSKKEIKRILTSEAEIPGNVNRGIANAYSEIGMDTKVTMRYAKKHRVLTAVAAVAALVAGLSIVTVAANKFLSANLVDKEEDKVGYNLQVDREKEAHEIKVEATYMPEGYEFAKDGPYAGKWRNEATDKSMLVEGFNAADLDRMERINGNAFMDYPRDEHMKNLEISGMKADVFVSDGFYTDSDDTAKNIYLFNEEFGYGIWISCNDNLPAEELIKVAEGLKVTVLDSVVPYATDEEIEKDKGGSPDWEAYYQAGVSKDAIYGIGDEVKNPLYDPDDAESAKFEEDMRFTVEDVQIKDAVSLDEYPAENYPDYDAAAQWINPDGTLKLHDRYRLSSEGKIDEESLEQNIASKFVVVKMKAKNCSREKGRMNEEMGIPMAPDLTNLVPRDDGNYSYAPDFYYSANEDYHLQWGSANGSSFPVYFDGMTHTEGIERQKSAYFRTVEPGEELEYTLIYVVDEDHLDNLYLWFYSGSGSTNDSILQPYVKIN
ncbi:DUF4367 domain-containing protein [Clostridium sp. AF19-22AC]|jgi:hypothetical protein|nr:DUF4367 domain-containing protein [Clostridium sp. AF19-22AC]